MCLDNATTVLDLFAGVGGFSRGFDEIDYHIIAGIDVDDDALATYAANHDAPAMQINLAETPPDELLDELGVRAEDIDVIAGGPPCQGFSRAGLRNSDDPRNKLVGNYFDIIDHVQPELFVMENVVGLLSYEDGEVIELIEENIEEMGYEYTYETLNSADYGVPQTRRRVIIVGSKYTPPTLPKPTCEDWIPIAEVLDGPPADENGEMYRTTSPSGGSAQVKGRDPFRLTDEPAYTHTGRYIHLIPSEFEPYEGATPASVQHRRLSMDEMALVQSFPDSFDWRGDKIMRQQGNAVPPLLAEAIASHLTLTSYQNLRAEIREETPYPTPTRPGDDAGEQRDAHPQHA